MRARWKCFARPYLLLVCALMLSHNLVSTFLYNGLAVLVNQEIVGFEQRTVFFSQVDLVVQVLAFTLQFFVTSRLLRHLGMPRTALISATGAGGRFYLAGQLHRAGAVCRRAGGAAIAQLWSAGPGERDAVHRGGPAEPSTRARISSIRWSTGARMWRPAGSSKA